MDLVSSEDETESRSGGETESQPDRKIPAAEEPPVKKVEDAQASKPERKMGAAKAPQPDPKHPSEESSDSSGLGEESEDDVSEAPPSSGKELTARPAKTTGMEKKAAELGLKAVAKGKAPIAKAAQPSHNQPAKEVHHKQPDPKAKATSTGKRGEATKEVTTAAAATEVTRTHCGYEWSVNELVIYNKPGKSKTDYVESLMATIVKFPAPLPLSDYNARAYITLESTPTTQPICVLIRSLEKVKKTERSQRSSTLRHPQPPTSINIDGSDEETQPVSNKRHKTDSRGSPEGTKWYARTMEHAARNASLPAPDEAAKEAFRVLLEAMITGLNGPSIAEMKAEKEKLERRYHKLQAAHATATTNLAAKEKALGDAATAVKAERTKRKKLATQIAELKAQVRTLEDQASGATGAETADPTAERQQKAELEKALADKNAELADVKQQLDTIKKVLGGGK